MFYDLISTIFLRSMPVLLEQLISSLENCTATRKVFINSFDKQIAWGLCPWLLKLVLLRIVLLIILVLENVGAGIKGGGTHIIIYEIFSAKIDIENICLNSVTSNDKWMGLERFSYEMFVCIVALHLQICWCSLTDCDFWCNQWFQAPIQSSNRA